MKKKKSPQQTDGYSQLRIRFLLTCRFFMQSSLMFERQSLQCCFCNHLSCQDNESSLAALCVIKLMQQLYSTVLYPVHRPLNPSIAHFLHWVLCTITLKPCRFKLLAPDREGTGIIIYSAWCFRVIEILMKLFFCSNCLFSDRKASTSISNQR